MAEKRIRHTMTSLISATGKSQNTIKEALDNGWFGPVQIITVKKRKYYSMAEGAVDYYKKKKYKSTVAVERKNEGTFFAYKYTLEEAKENANRRADEYMLNAKRVRLEMLNKPSVTKKDVRQKAYNVFLKEESGKTVKVMQGKISIDEQRRILELPLNLPTLILKKMTPEQGVYMLEKTFEYITSLGEDKWKEPWIRNTVINLIQEEIYQNSLHDLRGFQSGKVQSEIDEALTKSETRWIKLADNLGFSLKRTSPIDEEPHQRDTENPSGRSDNL